METFSAFCVRNSPVTGDFLAQRPVTRSLNERLNKQSWGWWFETPSRSLGRHCNERPFFVQSWWRHQMETFSAFCVRNSPVTGEFLAQRPVTRSLFERLNKQSWGWWFETSSRSLWRHCNDFVQTGNKEPTKAHIPSRWWRKSTIAEPWFPLTTDQYTRVEHWSDCKLLKKP